MQVADRIFLRCGAWLPLLLLFGGCTFLPSDGPVPAAFYGKSEILLEDNGPALSYALVKLSPNIVALSQTEQKVTALPPPQVTRPSADVRLGIGDSVVVTIFEAASGGLFIPSQAASRPGNFVSIPAQQIDKSGMITVPYAGQVRVAGLTPSQAQQTIVNRLVKRAIEPQVIVSVQERRAMQVSVLGDVNAPTQFVLAPEGIKLLGAIAKAGGPRYPAHETVVTIQRANKIAQVELTSVVMHPAENVQLTSGDVVFVSRNQKYFLAFGAMGPFSSIVGSNNRRIPFEDDNLSLAEAVAKAGGLQGNDRADPRAVYLYRQERRVVLERLGVQVNMPGDLIPTIYQVDLKEPQGYFLANNFYLKSKDMIFVADAPSVDVLKLMTVVNSVATTARETTGFVNDLKN